MILFQIFACITTVIFPTWAEIPYADVKVNIFDSHPRDFEQRVLHIMNTTHKFYEEHNVTSVIDTLASQAPYIGELVKTVTAFHKTMAEKSEWRILFTSAITDETLHEIAESEGRRMKSTMQTIESKINILGDSNPDRSNRKTVASILHTELDKMINFFDLKSALARKYPLLGAPPLIQLASLIAIFTPYAKALNPYEAMNPQISCKMRDVLLDYRPRAVNARLHQLHANASIFESKMKVMQMPFNEYGYNQTNPGAINCSRQPDETQPNKFWLKDRFGSDEYWVNTDDLTCVEDYAALVRHRVEQIFPVDLLSQVCVEPEPTIPSGYGSFTINIQFVFTYGEADGSSCKFYSKFGCNSFIKLIVDDDVLLQSSTTKDKFVYDAGITFTTGRILKNSTIKLEVWDESSAFWESDRLILTTAGDVDSFLKEPLRKGVMVGDKQNAIETVSFWQDEHQEA